MNELLNYLVARLSFLYNEFDARFADSHVHGPHAALELETGNLRVRLVRDRSQLFVDFGCVRNGSVKEWFSFDMIRQLLTNEIFDSATMDDKKAEFIHDHLPAIIEAFSPSSSDETAKKLRMFERDRAKRLFG